MVHDYKTIDLFGKLLFETIILEPPYKKPNLMHNEACFLYILKGEYDAISETERLRVEAEQSLLMKCGNYTCNMHPSKESKTYQALAIHFYPDILMKIYENKLPDFLSQNLPLDSGMHKLNNDLLIQKYIEGILFYFQNQELVTEEILILKLKEIILLLNQTKNAPAIRSLLSNLFNPSSHTFREIVKAHYYEPITLEELAILNNQSLSTFKREFKKIYNASPATYLRDKKLEKAEKLLLSTHLRTTDIAYECGFSNVSHFSKTFKNKHRISPTTYKLTHLDKSLNFS